MRGHVLLRDAHCVFPGCRRDSRACDLDDITPYIPLDQGGPPGQTSPSNLAPLCRTHHRIKTHTTWDYKRLDGGTTPGPHPPATSTTSPPPPAASHLTDHRTEEPDAPHPGHQPRPGPPARPYSHHPPPPAIATAKTAPSQPR